MNFFILVKMHYIMLNRKAYIFIRKQQIAQNEIYSFSFNGYNGLVLKNNYFQLAIF